MSESRLLSLLRWKDVDVVLNVYQWFHCPYSRSQLCMILLGSSYNSFIIRLVWESAMFRSMYGRVVFVRGRLK